MCFLAFFFCFGRRFWAVTLVDWDVEGGVGVGLVLVGVVGVNGVVGVVRRPYVRRVG